MKKGMFGRNKIDAMIVDLITVGNRLDTGGQTTFEAAVKGLIMVVDHLNERVKILEDKLNDKKAHS